MTALPRIDVLLAVVLTAVAVAEGALGLTVPVSGTAAVLAPLVTLPVATRRVRSELSVGVLLAGMLLQGLSGSDLGGGFAEPVALTLTLYAVASRTSWRRAAAWLAMTLLTMSVVVTLVSGPDLASLAYMATVVVGACGAGWAVRLTAERSELIAEHRLLQERSRIARELHDVVSHEVSAIVVTAAAERRSLPDGSPTGQALAGIEDAGRRTMRELRRLLGLLHADEHAPLTPQPGLDDLEGLVRSVRTSGTPVTLTEEGDRLVLGEGGELAAYRTVQESLTNVRKHAGPATVRVHLRWTATTLELEVLDDGTGRSRPLLAGGGFGLRAMRDRLQSYGGRLQAGPTGHGFRVRAVIPAQMP